CLEHWELEQEKQMSAQRWFSTVGAIFSLVQAMPALSAELNPAALVYQLPDQIKWNSPTAAGSQNALLVGRSAAGRYVRDPFRQTSALGRRQERGRFHFDLRRRTRHQYASRANRRQILRPPSQGGRLYAAGSIQTARPGRRSGRQSGRAARRSDQDRPYVVLNRFKPGNFSKPHFHPNDRFITVIKGTWWVATGNKIDKDNMVPM